MLFVLDKYSGNQLRQYEEKIKHTVPSIKLKFKNYTPYMGGDVEGRTFRLVNNDLEYVGGPQSYSIIGRMRWISRIALASFLRDSTITYKTVESAFRVRELFPLSHDDKLGKIGDLSLIQFIYGCINCSNRSAKQWASPFNLIVRIPREMRGWDLVWEPHRECFRRDTGFNDRYCTLLKGNDVKRGYPASAAIAPGKLEIEIEVQVKARSRAIEGVAMDLLPLYVATLYVTLNVFGVGKATTRGFGRFKLTTFEVNLSERYENVKEKIENMLNCLQDLRYPDKTLNEYLGLWQRFVGEVENNKVVEVPRLSSRTIFFTTSFRCETSVKKVIDLIGRVVTKKKKGSNSSEEEKCEQLLYDSESPCFGLPRHRSSARKKSNARKKRRMSYAIFIPTSCDPKTVILNVLILPANEKKGNTKSISNIKRCLELQCIQKVIEKDFNKAN